MEALKHKTPQKLLAGIHYLVKFSDFSPMLQSFSEGVVFYGIFLTSNFSEWAQY